MNHKYTTDFLFDREYYKRLAKILILSKQSASLGIVNCYRVNISIFKDINKPVYLEYLQNFYILKKNLSTLQHLLKKFDEDYKTTSQIYFA